MRNKSCQADKILRKFSNFNRTPHVQNKKLAAFSGCASWYTKGEIPEVLVTNITPLDSTPFAGRSFDLVVLRGAFFFIMDNPAILIEIHRLLGPGGLGFAGGGYGRDAPPDIVDGIAEESRRLNDALGRRRVSVGDLDRLLAATGLEGCTRIVEEGGVWLEMRCPESP